MIKTTNTLVASKEKLSFQLAAWLLERKKEVSFSDIEALPTVQDKYDVEEIIDYLVSNFDVEKVAEKKSSQPMLSWETVLKLRTNVERC